MNEDAWDGLAVHDFECKKCGAEDLVIVNFKAGEDCGPRACDCGGSLEVVISVRVDRFGETFPYFDRGLGVLLTSKAHRREVCRKLGVTPVDGDVDFSRPASALRRKNDADEKYVHDMWDRMENHPGYREYREARDKGAVAEHFDNRESDASRV